MSARLKMLSEFGLCFRALFAVFLTVSSADSVLYSILMMVSLTVFKIFMKMYVVEEFRPFEDQPAVYCCIFFFVIIAVVFLMNLLVALFSCADHDAYDDMLSCACREREVIIVETMIEFVFQ